MKFYSRKKMVKGLSKFLKKNTTPNYYRMLIRDGRNHQDLDNILFEITIIARNNNIIKLKKREGLFV